MDTSMNETDKLNRAEVARVSRRPVTVEEMSTPEARRIRHATLTEVLAVINSMIENRRVSIEDEAYEIRRVIEREWARLDS